MPRKNQYPHYTRGELNLQCLECEINQLHQGPQDVPLQPRVERTMCGYCLADEQLANPTPEEIFVETMLIRQGWSEREHQIRSAGTARPKVSVTRAKHPEIR